MIPSVPQSLWEGNKNDPETFGSVEKLRKISKPWLAGERMKTVIDRVSRRIGLSYTRTSDLWYGKARRVEDFEIQQIEAALQKRLEEIAISEMNDAIRRGREFEALLRTASEDFRRNTLAALGEVLLQRM